MSNFASLPSNNTDASDAMMSERRYITTALSNQFHYTNEEPPDVPIGITMFPDDSWDWHPFYWNKHMEETLVSKEDVWRFRSMILSELQIDDADGEYTCRSIMDSDSVKYLMENLEPGIIKKRYCNSRSVEKTYEFLKLCHFYYDRLSKWQQSFIFGRNNIDGKDLMENDMSVLKQIVSNVTGK